MNALFDPTEVLLRVTVGSHLHGFAGPDSDLDEWVVVPEPRGTKTRHATQCVNGRSDVTVIGLSTWMHYCAMGAPQALDVMFAEEVFVSVDRLGPLRGSYFADPARARDGFAGLLDEIVQRQSGRSKSRRHAFRLAENWRQMETTGRFNPTLDPQARQRVLGQARTYRTQGALATALEFKTGFTFRLEAACV